MIEAVHLLIILNVKILKSIIKILYLYCIKICWLLTTADILLSMMLWQYLFTVFLLTAAGILSTEMYILYPMT